MIGAYPKAIEEYREYSKVQNRSHQTYIEPARSMWETEIPTSILLAKIKPAQKPREEGRSRHGGDKTTFDAGDFRTYPRASAPRRARLAASAARRGVS